MVQRGGCREATRDAFRQQDHDMTVRDLLTMTCGHDEEPNVRRERRCGRLASRPFEDRTDI